MAIDHDFLRRLDDLSKTPTPPVLKELRVLAPTIIECVLNGYALSTIYRAATDLGRVHCSYRTFRESVVEYLLDGKSPSEFRKIAFSREFAPFVGDQAPHDAHSGRAPADSDASNGPKRLRIARRTVSHDPTPDPDDLIGDN